MLKVSGLFLVLSIGVFAWLLQEMGLLGYTRVDAADGSVATSAPSGSESVADLHRALEERKRSLDAKEVDLAARERTVSDKEALLREQMHRYEKIIDELRKQVAELKAQDNSRVEGFRNIYEQMEPKRAAHILDDVSVELAAKILSSLKQERSAQILGRMSPVRARQITEQYLARMKNPKVADPR